LSAHLVTHEIVLASDSQCKDSNKLYIRSPVIILISSTYGDTDLVHAYLY